MSGIEFKKYPDFVLHTFACDVAERALIQSWEAINEEPDERSVNAIAVKRAWIEGRVSNEELAAARSAAAISYAARTAASYAAYSAAWYAAIDAASYAAYNAAWTVARVSSDAARYAARYVARNAARYAIDAARYAAWTVARVSSDAARYASDATIDEEKRWQAEHIEKLHDEYKQSRASILRTLVRRQELLTPAAYDWTAETEEVLF